MCLIFLKFAAFLTCRFLNFNCRFLFLFDFIICETISLSSDFLSAKYRVYDYVLFRVVQTNSLYEIVARTYRYIQSFVYSYSFVYLVIEQERVLFISFAKSQDRRLTQIGICRFAFLFDFIVWDFIISRVLVSLKFNLQIFERLFGLIWSDKFSVRSIQELVDFRWIIRVSDCPQKFEIYNLTYRFLFIFDSIIREAIETFIIIYKHL